MARRADSHAVDREAVRAIHRRCTAPVGDARSRIDVETPHGRGPFDSPGSRCRPPTEWPNRRSRRRQRCTRSVHAGGDGRRRWLRRPRCRGVRARRSSEHRPQATLEIVGRDPTNPHDARCAARTSRPRRTWAATDGNVGVGEAAEVTGHRRRGSSRTRDCTNDCRGQHLDERRPSRPPRRVDRTSLDLAVAEVERR